MKEKSFAFAVRIVKLHKYLALQNEFVLLEQILRSGTSIGLNVEVSDSEKNKKNFVDKISIALKEAQETHYWLQLLFECEHIDESMFESLIADCNELIDIFTFIIKASKISIK